MVEPDSGDCGRVTSSAAAPPPERRAGREAHQAQPIRRRNPAAARGARASLATRRGPSSPMIARAFGLAHAAQAAISASVRPQPMQSAETGSTTQILTQGVEGSGADIAVI